MILKEQFELRHREALREAAGGNAQTPRAPYEQDPETVLRDFTVKAAGSFAIAPWSIAAIFGASEPVTDTL